MKLMLTSFGVEQAIAGSTDRQSMYHLMPPVSFRSAKEFFNPDYELLLLCDRIIMDEMSFNALAERPALAYSRVAETFRQLRIEGRIEFADFRKILQDNAALHQKMLGHDLQILDQWIAPLRDSLNIWRNFSRNTREIVQGGYAGLRGLRALGVHSRPNFHEQYDLNLHHLAYVFETMHSTRSFAEDLSSIIDQALRSSAKRKKREYRRPLREVLGAYLRYVNANLILGNELNVGFYDWQDFAPFYSWKFLSVGRQVDEVNEQHQQLETLFTVPFPDLAITSTSALLRALNDKRIEELRKLIDDAVAGKVVFDHKFAKTVLTEVLGSEIKSRKWRNIIGYITMPIGFIPWIGTPAQKIIEEAIGTPLERKLKQKHRWFYLLSDIAETYTQ